MRRDWPDARLRADGLAITSTWDPTGPVVIAGLGRKARVQYGDGPADAWERAMIAPAQRRGHRVCYRRKQDDAPVPAGVTLAPAGPIERVLNGAGLVITWHSN